MLIVGELINASRKSVGQAIKDQDEKVIRTLARSQKENGAHFIDVNAGVFVEQEARYLKWLVQIVQEEILASCCIDSPDPKVLEQALAVHKGNAMINSISLEKDRFNELVPVIAGTDHKIIALCMSDEGMPETSDQRVAIAEKLINMLVKHNVPLGNIYVDPLVQPISTNALYGMEFLESIQQIMERFNGCHTICGLTNVSYGLPERKMLNRTFLPMAVAKGLDGVIIDPMDTRMMHSLLAASALAGRDDFCMEYITAYRSGKLLE